jgi:hypothetical protein
VVLFSSIPVITSKQPMRDHFDLPPLYVPDLLPKICITANVSLIGPTLFELRKAAMEPADCLRTVAEDYGSIDIAEALKLSRNFLVGRTVFNLCQFALQDVFNKLLGRTVPSGACTLLYSHPEIVVQFDA